MTTFHQRTLVLLGSEPPNHKIDALQDWAKKQGITIPPAFLQWARLDNGEILERYSNDDHWSFHQPGLVTLEDGRQGLSFQRENQGNFDKLVLLDGTDDPPVLFAWLGREPWTPFCDHFSQAVLAQIFDWQYWVEIGEEPYFDKELTYTGDIELKGLSCLDRLRELHEELVTTTFQVEGQHFTEYRFLKSDSERITATETQGNVSIRITGKAEQVPLLEAALLQEFSSQVEPSYHRSSLGLARALEHIIANDWTVKLQHQFRCQPNSQELAALLKCHKAIPLAERVKGLDFPNEEIPFTLGGSDWGIQLQFSPKQKYWWFLERLEVC